MRGVPSDKAACLRGIEAHVLSIGYIAIDYNLMVFQDGDVWEGRGLPNEDAATKDHNTDSVSICAVGNFEIEAAPAAMVNAIGQAFRVATQQGWMVNGAAIYPHSATYSTACPGRNLNAQMGAIRAAYTSGGTTPEEDLTPTQSQQLADTRSIVATLRSWTEGAEQNKTMFGRIMQELTKVNERLTALEGKH